MEDDVKDLKTHSLTFLVREPKEVKATKTVFFFALSAKDSLFLPPFCHPVDTLLKMGVRVISTTLPFHENNEREYGIDTIWHEGKERLSTFLDHLVKSIDEIKEKYPGPFGAMGISRGGFISLHLAARCPDIKAVCAFAPMLKVKDLEEFDLFNKTEDLKETNIALFVGHNDIAIGTEQVIQLQKELLEKNKHGKIVTKISPSIGHRGHGTSDPIFHEGVMWAINQLNH